MFNFNYVDMLSFSWLNTFIIVVLQNHNEMTYPYVRMGKLERQEIISVSETVEEEKHFCTVGGNANWYSCCGNQYGGYPQN